MDWEDCVVDVHSVKLSKQVLETMFKKCGPVRSITHWRGQGEKPHVFFEYKAPSSTDSARAVGLDRSDLQVIKIANNEMLKKKFRELAHGPIHDRDQRCRPLRPTSRSTSSYHNRDLDINASGKDHRLPAKPAASSTYSHERDAGRRYEVAHREGAGTRDGQSWRLVSAFAASSSSSTRAAPTPIQADRPRAPCAGSAPSQFPSPSTRTMLEIDVSRLRTPDHASNHDGRDNRESGHFQESLPVTSKSFPLTPPVEASFGHKSRPGSHDISPAMIEIPHAGEIIKFDLERQLEADPAGIIRILSAVKADQKLWMMTAAHYKGKHNLEAARKVLEAGIDMAVQVGEETDTKPFWHLLGQINGSLQAVVSPTTSSFTSTADTNLDMVSENMPQSGEPSSSPKGVPRLPAAAHDSNLVPSPINASFSNASQLNDHHKPAAAAPKKPSPLPQPSNTSFPPHSRPTGPRKRETHLIPPPPSPVPPSGPMDTPSRLYSLQNEIGALREKQNAVLEDLSFARAAKRRAEDEVKEERSVRRKLEKHLRASEDALARSKRMEDAALDQVRREVEARRRAEGLLADLRTRQENGLASGGGSGAGHSLFTHPNVNDAAVLLQLASMIRGVPSSDGAVAFPFQNGGAGPVMSSSNGGENPAGRPSGT